MADSAIDQALKAAISAEISRAQRLSYSELQQLGPSTRTTLSVSGRPYETSIWSEPVPGDTSGAVAVLVDAWRKLPLGFAIRHMQGFVVTPDDKRFDIPEHDLWQYD